MMYEGQVSSSKNRGHRRPEYTQQELQEWLFSQALFHVLYSEWVASGYKRRLKPSVDRKCDDIHYCMNNIQLMTWDENNKKGSDDHKSGKKMYDQRPVGQYTKEGELVNEFFSISEATRQTGAHSTHIVKVCRRKLKTAGGYRWEYS